MLLASNVDDPALEVFCFIYCSFENVYFFIVIVFLSRSSRVHALKVVGSRLRPR